MFQTRGEPNSFHRAIEQHGDSSPSRPYHRIGCLQLKRNIDETRKLTDSWLKELLRVRAPYASPVVLIQTKAQWYHETLYRLQETEFLINYSRIVSIATNGRSSNMRQSQHLSCQGIDLKARLSSRFVTIALLTCLSEGLKRMRELHLLMKNLKRLLTVSNLLRTQRIMPNIPGQNVGVLNESRCPLQILPMLIPKGTTERRIDDLKPRMAILVEMITETGIRSKLTNDSFRHEHRSLFDTWQYTWASSNSEEKENLRTVDEVERDSKAGVGA
ncbi:hypothetical protein HNY73_017970 [Argiope bruennichi]|uniref:Uncharacterized protein n=1 Tax=Argiope bruennichi TaxID=94029 RepID=A0A8T0EBF2_ARGBR|nr:hypothetical protein HNY73_017970 [Argiope bruennichi]